MLHEAQPAASCRPAKTNSSQYFQMTDREVWDAIG